jgi:plasmid maintenance system killer protein
MVLMLLRLAAAGQVQVNGTVYERTARYGIAGVSVRATSGAGAVTDSAGHYSIRLPYTDSLSFSYQGKATMKFPVKEIPANRPFDMSLHIDVKVLPTVVVVQNDYKADSIANREEYRKVFDYAPDFLAKASNGAGAGVNLDLLLSLRKMKRMEAFRAKLEEDERQKYITHRFNKALVKKLTGLQAPALDTFMVQYRPSYEMLHSFENEYEYYLYIKDWGTYFSSRWKKEHPEQL